MGDRRGVHDWVEWLRRFAYEGFHSKSMKMKRKISISLTALMMILVVETPSALANEGSQLKTQINHIEKERKSTINHLQNKISALNDNKDRQESLANQVQKLESEIADSNYKIQVKQNSIQDAQENIQTLKGNIKMLQDRIKQRKGMIASRARVAYENGGSISYLKLILNANDFSDFINRIFFVNKIAEQDHAILTQQVNDKQNLEDNQLALQKTLNQLNNDLTSLKQMKADLDNKKETEQTLLAQLKEKATTIQLSVTSGQSKAAQLQKQENVSRKALLEWEKEQGIHYGSEVPQGYHIFIAPAQELEKTTGIPAAITLSQLILESGAGGNLSELATAGKNLFGIKGEGPAGTIYLTTHEVIGGQDITVEAGFKRYDSYYQSMVDHAKILKKSRYQYFLKNAHTLKDFAYGIQNGGYSTDPQYAAKLLDIIQAYSLAQYDTGSF